MLKVSPIQIEQGEATVPGLIIFGETEKEALEIAHMTRDHYEIPGSKSSIHVMFTSSSSDTVDLAIIFDASVGSVSIEGVEKSVLENIILHLREVEKYVILLGHDHKQMHVIASSTFSLFKNELSFDKVTHFGKANKSVDWNNLV